MPTDNDWLRRIAIAVEGGSPSGGLPSGDLAAISAALNPTLITLIATRTDTHQFNVPAGKRWRLSCGLVSMNTSAAVGNRRLFLDISDGLDVILSIRSPAVQTASQVATYSFAPISALSDFVNDFLVVPTPAIVIPGGGHFVLSGFEISDTVSSAFQVEEW